MPRSTDAYSGFFTRHKHLKKKVEDFLFLQPVKEPKRPTPSGAGTVAPKRARKSAVSTPKPPGIFPECISLLVFAPYMFPSNAECFWLNEFESF